MIDKMPESVKDRQIFIEFRLYFLGELRRADLVERFGIKEAAATRDIAKYREIAPSNIVYDQTDKIYRVSDVFQPVFEYQPRHVLNSIATGISYSPPKQSTPIITCEIPEAYNKPSLEIISVITRAIYLKKPVTIKYHSMNRLSTRDIVPFALAHDGTRWHVRCYDRKKDRQHFADFVLSRMHSAKMIEGIIHDHELPQNDIQWNRIVELKLVAHPNQEQTKGIEMDYGMENGELIIKTRAAMAGYILRRLNVDCSKKHKLKEPHNRLWLKNTLSLYDVENLLYIAPGFEAFEE